MNLVEFFHNITAAVGGAVVILAIHKGLGGSLPLSAAVGFIPGVIVGYLVGSLLMFIGYLCVEGVRSLPGRNKS